MTRESVINQLVYYLNYGFISKDLQEDIQNVLLNKKDMFVLERLLDSVEYELHKNTKNKFRNNDHDQYNLNTGIYKTKKTSNNIKSKIKNTFDIKHKNDSNKTINNLKETKQRNILLNEDDKKNKNSIKINQFKITPSSLKILNKKKKIKTFYYEFDEMKDFEIDLMDFEINDSNNSTSESQQEKNNNKNNNSLDFGDNFNNKEKTINEIAAINNLVENIVFPDDDKMPELDEDIINLEFTGEEDILPNSIQPLADADVVFNLNSNDKNNK